MSTTRPKLPQFSPVPTTENFTFGEGWFLAHFSIFYKKWTREDQQSFFLCELYIYTKYDRLPGGVRGGVPPGGGLGAEPPAHGDQLFGPKTPLQKEN